MRAGAERAATDMGRRERVRRLRGIEVPMIRREVEETLWRLEEREGGERRDKEEAMFGEIGDMKKKKKAGEVGL